MYDWCNLLNAISMRLDAHLVDLLYNILIKQRTLPCLYIDSNEIITVPFAACAYWHCVNLF